MHRVFLAAPLLASLFATPALSQGYGDMSGWNRMFDGGMQHWQECNDGDRAGCARLGQDTRRLKQWNQDAEGFNTWMGGINLGDAIGNSVDRGEYERQWKNTYHDDRMMANGYYSEAKDAYERGDYRAAARLKAAGDYYANDAENYR
jgi:hypothetical protein